MGLVNLLYQTDSKLHVTVARQVMVIGAHAHAHAHEHAAAAALD